MKPEDGHGYENAGTGTSGDNWLGAMSPVTAEESQL
jgi:hypothetical protein